MDKQLISLINKLQDVFTRVAVDAPFDLPQIAVIGSQSSGKSSVLENIVGRDFLPRGSGIVTRRPLILQLVNRPAAPTANGKEAAPADEQGNETNPDEYGVFSHLKDQKFYDFSKIRDEIVRDTERLTGKNAGISPQPINLTIYSPNVVTLTLVDLPGLTKVPVGDQPRDIERQIRAMINTYIERPGTIILAVTAANTDLANSDGLQLAREKDPHGERTIGVLTKVDLMDRGTDVVDILAGRIIPLRLGYVPVVNRGQRDIDQKKAISGALDAESKFFAQHESYKNKAQYCGTPFLARKLNQILMHHIRSMLPSMKKAIADKLVKYQTELAGLGGAMGGGNGASIILQVITEFCSEFRTIIDGGSNDLNVNELSGGARISFVYHELFNTGIKSIDPFDQVKDGDVRTILYNSSGSTPSLFVGTAAFEVIVKQQIKRLESPSITCCDLVHEELKRIVFQILNKIQYFRRYPALKEQFSLTILGFLQDSMIPTKKLVSDMVNMQACYVNTTHPDFINGHKAMSLVSERINASKPPEKIDPKKTLSNQVNNNKDLDVDLKADQGGFFSTFFPAGKAAQPKRKGAGGMEVPAESIRPQAALSERESMETEVIKLLIHSYFNIVKREMIDMVPKSISYTLVQQSKDNLQTVLLENLYKPEMMETLMREDPLITQKRRETVVMVEALQKAEVIVSGV